MLSSTPSNRGKFLVLELPVGRERFFTTKPDFYGARYVQHLGKFRKKQADVIANIVELSLDRKVKAVTTRKWLELRNRIRTIVTLYGEYR